MPTHVLRTSTASRVLPLALAAWLLPATLGAQQSRPAVFTSDALEVAVGGRVQAEFNTTSVETEPDTEWGLRRVRLQATVKVNEWVTAKIQPEYAGSRVSVRDAFVRFAFDPAFNLVAGQANRPFGTITPTSSSLLPTIDRGLRIRGLPDAREHYNLISDLGYSNRDVGLQVTGAPEWAPLGLSYAVGMFNGPAREEAGERNSYQFAARVAARPVDPLRVGVSWSRRDFMVPAVVGAGPPLLRRGHAWAVDAEYGRYAPGLHLLGEAAFGDLDPGTGAEFRSAQGWVGYRTGALGPMLTGIEPVVRVSYGSVDGESARMPVTGGTLFTPGVNLYFGPQSRIMIDYDLWSPEEGGSDGGLKVMFQAGF